MNVSSPPNFTRLADGTWLQRHEDGSYRPIPTGSDRVALARFTDDEIERMAASDPDHPALDDAFWAEIDARQAVEETVSIKLDGDVLSFFRRQGRSFQSQINAVLRKYVETQR